MAIQTQEEVTTIENVAPANVVTKTTTQLEPEVRTEAPQKVFDKKKKIFRINQIIWYILGFVEVLLIFRLTLKAMGANSFSGFTSFIYAITSPLASPFRGVIGESLSAGAVIEWSTMFAIIVYLVVAVGLVYLLNIVNPVTPEEVVAGT
jgi:uncharacterized protein YggT (Ycf19 family)